MTTATIEPSAFSEKLKNLKQVPRMTTFDRPVGYPKMASGISRYGFGKVLGNVRWRLNPSFAYPACAVFAAALGLKSGGKIASSLPKTRATI